MLTYVVNCLSWVSHVDTLEYTYYCVCFDYSVQRLGCDVLSFVFLYILFFAHSSLRLFFFFFFNDTATPEIYPLSLHDALPISGGRFSGVSFFPGIGSPIGGILPGVVLATTTLPCTALTGNCRPPGSPESLNPIVEIGRAHV